MQKKYLFRFIQTWSPHKYDIPAEIIYSEACHQRDMFREKIRNYYQNGQNERYKPSCKIHDYVFPIMRHLQERTALDFPMIDEDTFLHPQPAYLVLAAWHFLLATDDKINKFWEKNTKEHIMKYLKCCSSMNGICDDLQKHLHDYNEAMQPLSLFDVPTAVPAPRTTLPTYPLQALSKAQSAMQFLDQNGLITPITNITINTGTINNHYCKDSIHEDHSKTIQFIQN